MKRQFTRAKGQAGRGQPITKGSVPTGRRNGWHKLPGTQGTLEEERGLEGEGAFLGKEALFGGQGLPGGGGLDRDSVW